MNKIYIFYIIIIIFFIIIIINYYTNNPKYTFIYKGIDKDKLNNRTISRVLLNNNIKYDKDNWNIFIPNSYNNIENILFNIKLNINSKIIFGINGCDELVSKNKLYINLINNNINNKHFLPKTFILSNKSNKEKFINNFNKNKIYILKKNIQSKKGITITNNLSIIKKLFNDSYILIQEYINDSLLINGRKMNLRLYLIVIIKNNKKKFYIHKNKKCLYANKIYNNNFVDLNESITSSELNKNVYNNLPLDYNELIKYLKKNNYNIKLLNKNLNNIFNIIVNTYKNILFQSSNLNSLTSVQLFGIDILIKNNLDTILLEINKGPVMRGVNKQDQLLKEEVYEDIFNKLGITNKLKKNKLKKIN